MVRSASARVLQWGIHPSAQQSSALIFSPSVVNLVIRNMVAGVFLRGKQPSGKRLRPAVTLDSPLVQQHPPVANRTLVSRASLALCDLGLKGALARAYVLAMDRWFDLRYGTETNHFVEVTQLSVASPNKKHAHSYMGTRIVPLRRLLRRLRPLLPRERVLLDFGCGKGRVLMIASEFGFRRAKGIEFVGEFCRVARANCANFKRLAKADTDFQVVESDVVDYAIQPEENVFFLYNPFDEVVLKRVLSNIAKSLEAAPRDVVLIYANPELSQVVEQQGSFERFPEISFWGYRFAVYFRSAVCCLAFLFGDFVETGNLLMNSGEML